MLIFFDVLLCSDNIFVELVSGLYFATEHPVLTNCYFVFSKMFNLHTYYLIRIILFCMMFFKWYYIFCLRNKIINNPKKCLPKKYPFLNNSSHICAIFHLMIDRKSCRTQLFQMWRLSESFPSKWNLNLLEVFNKNLVKP